MDAPIWLSKQRILCTLNQSLKDVLNYGLFQPAYNGKAGKFLDEERQLREYPFPSLAPVPYLEVGMSHMYVWGLKECLQMVKKKCEGHQHTYISTPRLTHAALPHINSSHFTLYEWVKSLDMYNKPF